MSDIRERPNSFPWPPILFLGALIGASVMARVLPVPLPLFPEGLRAEGATLIVLGVALIGWAFLAFRNHKTTVMPHQRSDALISTGPFAWSRNPIYLGEVVILAGLGLHHGSLWHLIAIVIFMLALTRLAIEREEAHLAARFGDQWLAYRAKVRRWL